MRRGPHILPVSMFLGSFAWSFVYVSLPFYLQTLSTADPATTLRSTGWILGITSLVNVVTAPLWGRLAERVDPRKLYVLVEALQGAAFLGMAVARTLPEMFLARFVLGFMGAASTFAFMLVGRERDEARVRRQVGAIQSAMTVGQVIGPLAGAVAAARLGFRASFVVGAAILFACALLVQWGVAGAGERRRPGPVRAPAGVRELAVVALLVLGGSTHIFFLAAILPEVLLTLGVPSDRTLEVGGIIIFASGAAAALGSMAAARLGELVPERRLIPGLLIGAAVCVAALAVATSAWLYGLLRFLQVLCVAPLFPVVVAGIAHRAGGQAIGIVNAARIGAGFLGPVVAASVVSFTAPWVLYALLAAIGVACVPLARLRDGGRPA
jgi:MFS family permease